MSTLAGGTPSSRREEGMVPYPRFRQRGVPDPDDGRGTPSKVQVGDPIKLMGGTPSQVWMGVPHPRPGWEGVPHPKWGDQDWMGYPPTSDG